MCPAAAGWRHGPKTVPELGHSQKANSGCKQLYLQQRETKSGWGLVGVDGAPGHKEC